MARPRKNLDATEVNIAQGTPRVMSSFGDADLSDSEIEVVDGPNISDRVKMEAFMAENVEVYVHDSTDENAEPLIQVGVNGRNQFFERGTQQTVKRMFVAALARAKQTTYKEQEYLDARGNRAVRYIPRTALKYPFSIVYDANPNGIAWLEKTLAEH